MSVKRVTLFYFLGFFFCIKSIEISKQNIMMILIDDLRHPSLINTRLKNINKIAAHGADFQNAFAQQALCDPSRNSLLTGRRPDSLRLYDFYSYWRHKVANFTTLPQFFKENGYDTYSVGKVFHSGLSSNFSDDYPYSWSKHPYYPPTVMYNDAAVCKSNKTKTLHSNLVCPVTVSRQPGKNLPDLESLKYAINILKKRNKRSKPFFLAVGFYKPHIPFKFPKEYLNNVSIDKVQLPKYPHKPAKLPSVAWHPWTDLRSRDEIKRLNIPFPFGTMPQKWTLKIRQSYLAAATYVDALIGTLISNIDMRKTLIVLTSDHGWSLGENGLWAKYSNFDVALRVPLIFASPKLQRKTIHTPVELIDIFPTIVELAGFTKHIPQCKNRFDRTSLCFEGKSLVPMMRAKDNDIDDSFAISQYPRPNKYPDIHSDKPRLKDIKIMGYSLRTKRYRYTEWVSFNNKLFKINWNKIYGVELYDHNTDPDESDNLQSVYKYKHVKNKLSTFLRLKVDPKRR